MPGPNVSKIDQKIQLHASGLGNMNEIIQNYEDYENVPEQMKTTIAMLASGKINPSFDSDDIKIGNYGLSEIAIAFNNANKISGTSDYSAGLVNNISNNLLKKSFSSLASNKIVFFCILCLFEISNIS